MRKTDSTLKDLLASLVNSMDYEFVGCELQKHDRRSLLRVYIDSEHGITVEDCARVSRQISAMMDVEDPIKGEYTLEVSSPGIDRPLFELAHYQKRMGDQVKIRLYSPLNGRRNFVGFLLRVEGENIHLKVDLDEVILPFSTIEKAKVIADNAG